jgi:putative transposase
MARPWRIQFPGAVYHVMARGNNRQEIFLERTDQLDFLELLARFTTRFGPEIFAFCLMTNHYHLFLRTPQPNLCSAMQWLNGTYTNRFNRRHHRNGHLLQGRYKSVLVADEAHWLHLSAYIHLNPLRAGLAADPAGYEWSSFRDFTRARCRFPWLRPESILALYGASEPEQRRRYRQQVLALAGIESSWWQEISDAVFLGTQEQWERLKQERPPRGRRDRVADYGSAPPRLIDIKTETARVARLFGVSAPEIAAGRRRDHVRPALYYHLVEHCGLTGARVAEHFHLSEMAVSAGLTRLRHELTRNPALSDKIKELSLGSELNNKH